MNDYHLAHIKKSCIDKKRYMSQGMAAIAAHEFMSIRTEVLVMGAYRCSYCNDWHLTKKLNYESSPTFLVIPKENIITKGRVERRRKERKCQPSIEKERRIRNLLQQNKE